MIFPHSECADLIVGSMINEIKVVALYTGALGFALVTLTDLEKLELACTIFQSALNALENEYTGCIGASSEILAAEEEEEGREREGYRWRRAVLRRRKGCKLLSRDKLERMMDVKKGSVMKMGNLERVLMEKRITMEIAEGELVVESKDGGLEELSRPEENIASELFVGVVEPELLIHEA